MAHSRFSSLQENDERSERGWLEGYGKDLGLD